MIENVTLGEFAIFLAFLVTCITTVKTLRKHLRDTVEELLKDSFEKIEKSQADIMKRLNTVDLENCKNYLVTFLAELSRGEPKDETERQRFWEEYEHYTQNGGNSYIKNKVEEMKAKRLL